MRNLPTLEGLVWNGQKMNELPEAVYFGFTNGDIQYMTGTEEPKTIYTCVEKFEGFPVMDLIYHDTRLFTARDLSVSSVSSMEFRWGLFQKPHSTAHDTFKSSMFYAMQSHRGSVLLSTNNGMEEIVSNGCIFYLSSHIAKSFGYFGNKLIISGASGTRLLYDQNTINSANYQSLASLNGKTYGITSEGVLEEVLYEEKMPGTMRITLPPAFAIGGERIPFKGKLFSYEGTLYYTNENRFYRAFDQRLIDSFDRNITAVITVPGEAHLNIQQQLRAEAEK